MNFKSLLTPFKNIGNWLWSISRKKKIISLGIILIIIGIVIYFKTKPVNPIYKTDSVTKDTIMSIVSESGNVSSENQVIIYSNYTGLVEKVSIGNGSVVNAGDVLFSVKSTASKEEKSKAYAAYLTAVNNQKLAEQNKMAIQAQLEKGRQEILDTENAMNYKNTNTQNPSTRREYTELEKLSIDSANNQAKQDFATQEKKYKEADANISAAKASTYSAWLAYQATLDGTMTSPLSGTIANLAVANGDSVTANSKPVLVISNSNKQIVKVQFNEVDINKISLGQKANITFDAIKNKTYTGIVERIDSVGINTSGVITFNVYIGIVESEPQIKAQMTANVEIETDKHENVLTVLNSAIKPYKGGKAVQLLNKDDPNGEPTFVPVKIGIRGFEKTEILEGIDEGTQIIVGKTSK